MQALSRIRFLFFLFLQQRLNYWPCLPVHILTNVTKKTEERCVNCLYGPHYHVPNKEKQQILRKWRIFNIINPIDIIDNWYTWYNEYNYNMIIINDNCHDQSFVHVFSQRTFLCALQFRSFHLKYFFYIFWLFRRSPVLLQSFPVEAELYRDVSAVFRAMCIVWLIGVPILKIFCDQHLQSRTVPCPCSMKKS